jgi:hypothetical protein
VHTGLAQAAAFTAALFFCCAAAAAAEPVEATLSLSIDALHGSHEVAGGQTDRLDFAPLPLGELNVRHGADSLRVEGLPPVTFGYSGATDGVLSTRLSIINATYRRGLGGGFFVGAGQTIYNQITAYVPVFESSQEQYSRVTGFRVEAGRHFTLGRERVEASVSANPRMRGVQHTRIANALTFCSFGAAGRSCTQVDENFADPEAATQVDIALRLAHRVSKRGELLYGLRYLNYSAHYDDAAGQLADRDVGFAPVLGYRVRL